MIFTSFFLVAGAFAQSPSQKLGPGLKMIVQAAQTPSGALRKATGADLTQISILIKGSPGGVRSAVLRAGGQIGTHVGNITTARITPKALVDLARDAAVERIERSVPKRHRNDQAAIHTGAAGAHTGRSPLPQAYTGKGVVVGVIDTGIDFMHKDFRDPSDPTKSRILAVWDMDDEAGPPPEGYAYGALWTQAQIEAALRGEATVRQKDTDGHGTHVAGSAAGNGAASGAHRGMAYEADIVIVKGNHDEVDAANFIFSMADELGKPAVINYSQGTHFGPHDGTTLEEQALNDLVKAKPGRVFVAAAGNEGESFLHWGGFPLGTDPVWTYYHFDVNGNNQPVENDLGNLSGTMEMYGLFYETDINTTFIGMGVDSTDYTTFSGYVNPRGAHGATPWYSLSDLIALPGASTDTLRYTSGEPAGVVSFTAQELSSGKVGVQIAIEDFIASADLEAVGVDLWRLLAKGSGTIHAWSEGILTGAHPSVDLAISDPQYRPTDSNYTVGLPATASELIAVGAFTNAEVEGESAQTGALSNFSSIGPTVDGRIKPDIVSPGENVISTRSSDYQADATLLTTDGLHYRESGTSMASPVTAGAIGLLLQKNPTASYTDIKTLLAKHAATDEHTASFGALPNAHWGAGKLNILAMMTDGEDGNAGGAVVLPTGERGPIALDLDAVTGDQKKLQTDANPKAGENITIDVVAVSGAQGNVGFQVVIEYDPAQFEWVNFQLKDLFAAGAPLPTIQEGKATISVAILGGTAAANAGSMGHAVLKVKEGFTGEARVTLTSASYDAPVTVGPGGAFVVIGGVAGPSYPAEPVARANFSGSGKVGFNDFLVFAGAFGSKSGGGKYEARIDLNDDGAVNFNDFLLFAQAFGKTVGE